MNRVAVGYVTRTKGVRGHVKVEVLTHRLSRFDELSQVVIEKEGLPDIELRIDSWRPEQPGILMKFVNVDSREDAREILVKGYVTIDADDVAVPPENEFYISDLIGCTVVDEKDGCLGSVVEVMQMPSTDVYVVRNEERELLIPAVVDFVVEVSIRKRRIVVKGLNELPVV